MIGSNSDRSAFKAWSPKPRKAINVYAHHDDLRSFAQLAISVLDRRNGLTSDRTHDQRTNAYKLARGSWLTSLTIILFTRVASRTKSKGAPDQRSTHLLLLSPRASPHIKSKGLYRYVLQIYYFINQVFKSFLVQQVSSSMVWLYPKCDRTPSEIRGPSSRIRIGWFSTKRECI
jgi:hypothetical protein